jgi:Zinc carboxypeptidase
MVEQNWQLQGGDDYPGEGYPDHELIGFSEEGRPLPIFYIGETAAPLRILIMAGQHGDEPLAMEAVANFATVKALSSTTYADCYVAVLSCLNPDGLAAQTRKNARGIDLNRDHQLLAAAETQALHRFVRAWRPHLIVDVHTYPPRRRHLLQHNLVYCHDVFLDIPTNPAITHPLYDSAHERFLRPVLDQLITQYYQSARYTLVRPSGKVRHSTSDLVDARNGLALRYGAFTVLLEGRQIGINNPARPHVHNAQMIALHEIITWAQQNSAALCVSPPLPQLGTAILIRTRAVYTDSHRIMLFVDAESRATRLVTLPGRYAAQVAPTHHVHLPVAYAVPRTHVDLLAILARHGFHHQTPIDGKLYTIDQYHVERITTSTPHLRVETLQRPLNNFLLFPIVQEGGHALALFLEPAAKYGLARFPQAGLSLQVGTTYPILRVTTENP